MKYSVAAQNAGNWSGLFFDRRRDLKSELTMAVICIFKNGLLAGDHAEVDVGNMIAKLGHASSAVTARKGNAQSRRLGYCLNLKGATHPE